MLANIDLCLEPSTACLMKTYSVSPVGLTYLSMSDNCSYVPFEDNSTQFNTLDSCCFKQFNTLNVGEGIIARAFHFPPRFSYPPGALGHETVHWKNVRTGKECGCFPFG